MLAQLLPRPWGQIDKRGKMLMAFGFIWVAIGWSVLSTPDPAGWEHLPIIAHVSRETRATAWIVSGTLAFAFAWRPQAIRHDGIGFLALYVMPAERVLIFCWGWIDAHTPGFNVWGWEMFGGPGYERGLYSSTVWLAILLAVMVTASPDNTPLDHPAEDQA